jgi:hypothetical protein
VVGPKRDRKGVTMDLRPTNGDKDACGADPLVRAGPPGPALRGFVDFSSRPTRASAADQGVRPTLTSTERVDYS